MKRLLLTLSLCALLGSAANAEKLVILHTNDTHSQIEPTKGAGGLLNVKAVMDSVRKAEKNVMAIDAGDMVQGSLYFKFFRGDVEYPLFNMMNYDIRILGNHEFDNGLEEMAKHYKEVKAKVLSANYDFTGTPMEGLMAPYMVKKIGGKRIGFFGLNVDPESLIAKKNYEGMKFKDILETANATAAYLKEKEKCDLVVAVTHIGYTSDTPNATTDPMLAAGSKDIDIIIGGHSHTLINPANPSADTPYFVDNAAGKPVLIAQTGKYARYVGKIEIDLDNLQAAPVYSLIPVTDRFTDKQLDKRMSAFLQPYVQKVDSVNHRVIAHSKYDLSNSDPNGGYANWISDYARWYGDLVLDSIGGVDGKRRVDMGLMNVGGIRMPMRQGDVTEGQILNTFPFANLMTIVEIKGSDLIQALDAAAYKGGEGVSENVRVVAGPNRKVERVIIDNVPVDPDKYYLVSTIDYLAEGNDYLVTMANGRRVWTDDKEMSAPLLRYVYMLDGYGLPIAPDPNGRFIFKE